MSDVKGIHDFTHGRHVLLFMRYVTRNLKLCTSASGTPPHVQRVEMLYRLPLSSPAILSLSLPQLFCIKEANIECVAPMQNMPTLHVTHM